MVNFGDDENQPPPAPPRPLRASRVEPSIRRLSPSRIRRIAPHGLPVFRAAPKPDAHSAHGEINYT